MNRREQKTFQPVRLNARVQQETDTSLREEERQRNETKIKRIQAGQHDVL